MIYDTKKCVVMLGINLGSQISSCGVLKKGDKMVSVTDLNNHITSAEYWSVFMNWYLAFVYKHICVCHSLKNVELTSTGWNWAVNIEQSV